MCCKDFLKSLPYSLFFSLTHHLTSACPFCSASLSSPLSCFLSLCLTLPCSAFPSLCLPVFSSPSHSLSLSLSPFSCMLDLSRCSQDCVSPSPPAQPPPPFPKFTPSTKCHHQPLELLPDPPAPDQTTHEYTPTQYSSSLVSCYSGLMTYYVMPFSQTSVHIRSEKAPQGTEQNLF